MTTINLHSEIKRVLKRLAKRYRNEDPASQDADWCREFLKKLSAAEQREQQRNETRRVSYSPKLGVDTPLHTHHVIPDGYCQVCTYLAEQCVCVQHTESSPS